MDDDDDFPPEHWKFPECAQCVNRCEPDVCEECDNGEFFEEEEPAGVDTLMIA